MRRKDREVTEKHELLEIIAQCKVCRLGVLDAQGVYIVPMNFGYTYEDDQLSLFFHSAKEGRKIDALRANASVCFEMDCGHQLLEAKTPCGYGYAFKSIIGQGQVSFIQNIGEKELALKALMRQQCGREFAFSDCMMQSVVVFKIVVECFSGKVHE